MADEEGGEEQAAAAPEAPVQSGSKKSSMLLVLLVVLNMAAVVFVGAMLWMTKKGQEGPATTVEDLEKKADLGDGSGEGADEEGAETIGKSVPMETFLVNLSGSRGRSMAKVDMEFEVDGDRVADEIEKRKPQIRDIVIILLSSKTYAEIEKTEGKNALRDEIRDTVNAFLTKGKIKRVLFTNLIFNR